MKILVFINGLLPNTRDCGEDGKKCGSRFYIRISKEGHNEIERIGEADMKGEYEFFISDKYIHGEILIRIRHRWYKQVELIDTVKEFGYFYTAKIQHDYTFWKDCPSKDPEWETENEYVKASNVKNDKIRKHRFKNRIIRFVYFGILILAPIFGYILQGIAGVGFSVLIAIGMELLGPYSIGLKRMF